MSLSSAENSELRELLDRLCEGSLEEAGSRRLQTLAIHDRDSRDLYVRYLRIHSELQWLCREQTSHLVPSDAGPSQGLATSEQVARLDDLCRRTGVPVSDPIRMIEQLGAGLSIEQILHHLWVEHELSNALLPAVGQSIPSATLSQPPSVSRWGQLKPLALAAAFLVAITLVLSLRQVTHEEKATVVATLVRAQNCRWEDARVVGDRLAPQRLRLRSGLAELAFASGAAVVLEGPAEFSVDGDNRATLKRGKLVARVPKQAIGFTLDTPNAKIVDLGTEFGVDVNDSGQADVHVLTGQIESRKLSSDGTTSSREKPLRVVAGQAIRIDAAGRATVAIPANPAMFQTKFFTNSTTSLPEVINGVTATESSFFADRKGLMAVNGKGLDNTKNPPTHSNDAYGTTWVSDPDNDPAPRPWLRADLGKLYDLTEMRIWNYNETDATDAGTHTVEVWVSDDDRDFRKVMEIRPEIATGRADYVGEPFRFTSPTTARYVKLVVLFNHSQRLAECGLSEIQFKGTEHK